ncbi:condensin-2 complex subunit D3 [Rhinatrema bivittatum]|uniref:condensin-2 complex subunit D3 n=1 Tax=Rhinatrema bivittatum TaxID=194408 RepID=UPI00112EEB9C|nr:condensin-2 complex subunit D3 [Rhinatrema bivittatum]
MARGGEGEVATQLIEVLELWALRGRLSDAWVDVVWELDFTETEPLDSKAEDAITEHGMENFIKLYKSLSPFAAEDYEATVSIWTLFAESNISHKALVAVLHQFIQMVENKKASVVQRLYALHAAALYFLLLEIPGSVANQVFHPVLFDKCLGVLRESWPQESDSNRKRKKDVPKSSQGDHHGGRKKARSTRREDPEMDDIFEEDEGQDDMYFSARDLLEIRDAIFFLLKKFLRLLPKFALKEKFQSVQHCIQIFIELTSFEPVQEFDFSESFNIKQMKYVPELAYHGLKLLCSPLHGEGDQTIRRLFQRILNIILMIREGSSQTLVTISPQVISARNQAIRFISYLVDELKEAALPIFLILLQHICAKTPDKSEYRTHAAQALVKLLSKLPSAEFAGFMVWLYKYSKNTKISYRVFALEVIMALLNLPERELDSALPPELQKFLQHKFLVQAMVLGRCSDKAPTVRSKALSCFAQCLEMQMSSGIQSITILLQGTSVFGGTGITPESSLASSEATSSRLPQKSQGTFRTVDVSEPSDSSLSDGKEIMAMLHLRAGDEKTNVRKAAVQVVLNILKYSLVPCTSEDLSVLQDRCRDPAVSVRKQALQSLTDLLKAQTHNVLIQKAWLTGVVPVVIDSENSVQEKALECLDQLILQHVKRYSKLSQDDSQKLAWDLLAQVTSERQELSRYLTKAFHIWSKQGRFSSTFINNLISHTETEHCAPAWMLLAKVAGSSPKLDYTRILDTWDSIRSQRNGSPSTTGHILCVIGHVAVHLPQTHRGKLIDDVKDWLLEFLSPPEVISPAVESLQKLCHAHADTPEHAQVLLNQVCGDLISACEKHISHIILTENGAGHLDEVLLVRHLFTLGEAAQLCPAKVEKKVFLLVQSILASSVNTEQSISSPEDGDFLVSQPLSQFRGSTMSPLVRAHAFITLGKLCLQHEDLAKKCIAAFARELEVCEDVAIRNNVVIVMCDLCVRYTTMVDRYIPNVSVCLRDKDPFIRKQTLIMLTNLLQEEFVKWKGSLFFRFISVVVDPDPDISRFGEFCLVHLLLKRNPVMFSQHFIECIFHFNSYEKHEKYNKFPQSEREKKLFSLKGKDNKEKRMKIYKFLLEHFTDEQRFNITTKLSQNVLACFVDGILPLDMEANDLLSDTFNVLSCKEIKLSAMRSKPGEDIQPDDDEMAMANAVMQVAQKKLISQVQKKNFIENIIPIITSLKSFLEQKKIPALRDLMNYLREVMQDYRNEIKDFFAVDKQLAAELDYDMKKYEEQLVKEHELGEQEDREPNTEVPAVLRPPQVSTHDLNAVTSPDGMKQPAEPGLTSEMSPEARLSTPLQITPTPMALVTPQIGMLKAPMLRPRQMSLNTLAILESAKKAIECCKKQRSKSFGAQPDSPFPAAGASSKRVSIHSIDLQQSKGSRVSVVGRAISTPDQTIGNVTFGAGVSYISMARTPSSAKERTQDQQQEVLYMRSPDKDVLQPQQWKVESPVRRKSHPAQSRRSSRKTPLKTAN